MSYFQMHHACDVTREIESRLTLNIGRHSAEFKDVHNQFKGRLVMMTILNVIERY